MLPMFGNMAAQDSQGEKGGMMELKLNGEEVKVILLNWAEKEFPGCFNRVHVDAQYGAFRHVEFSKEISVEPA